MTFHKSAADTFGLLKKNLENSLRKAASLPFLVSVETKRTKENRCVSRDTYLRNTNRLKKRVRKNKLQLRYNSWHLPYITGVVGLFQNVDFCSLHESAAEL